MNHSDPSRTTVAHPDGVNTAALEDRLRDGAQLLLQKLDAPGSTVALVLPEGAVISACAGVADKEAAVPMPLNARMPGGSTGKTIVAATALSLALEKRLFLDAPVARWLDQHSWFERLPNARDLTLRMLLTHTGGVVDHMGLAATFDLLRRMRARDPEVFLKPSEAIELILHEEPVVKPGAGFFYSDTSYILAGLVIEAATGNRFYDEALTRVLRPWGLNDFEPAIRREVARLVPGYTDAPIESGLPRKMTGADGRMVYSPAHEWTGGGYFTSARDLARFIWLYASGRVFPEAYLHEVKRTVPYSWSAGHVGGYGLGVFSSRTSLGPAWNHGGYFSGYRSQMTYFPALDVALGFQVNSSAHFGGYQTIVAARREAAQTPPTDTTLTLDDTLAVTLTKSALGLS